MDFIMVGAIVYLDLHLGQIRAQALYQHKGRVDGRLEGLGIFLHEHVYVVLDLVHVGLKVLYVDSVLGQLHILDVLDLPAYLEMRLLDGLVNLLAQVVLRGLELLWDALIQLVEDEFLQLVQLALSLSGRLIDVNEVLPGVVVLLLEVLPEALEFFALPDQLRHGELLLLEGIELLLEVLGRVLLVLLYLLVQCLLSSLDE